MVDVRLSSEGASPRKLELVGSVDAIGELAARIVDEAESLMPLAGGG